jgi:hypothetical protein
MRNETAGDLISRSALLKLFDECMDRAHIQAATRRTGKTLWSGICTGVNWGRNTVIDAPAVDAVDRKKLIGVLFPLGVPLTKEDWNYSINAKAVYEAIMREV